MKHIVKTISLEEFKCRTPNILLSFKDNKYLYPYDELFYNENPNGNYNAFPSDIILPEEFSFSASSSSTVSSYTRHYSFDNISALTNTSVNFYSEYLNDSSDAIENDKMFYKLIRNSDGSISYYSEDELKTETKRILSYKRLYKWFNFFKFYYRLLYSTTCENEKISYASAEEYYYSNNIKKDYETLEYCQDLDKTFLERGGVIERDEYGNSLTHCDLFDWMREFIFITYDLKTSVYVENGISYPLKIYAQNWTNTILNINSLMYWFTWFYRRYKYFSGVTDCSTVDYSKTKEFTCCDCDEYQKLGGDIMYKFLKQERTLYFEKALAMREYCSKTAEISIPIVLQNSNKNIGEFTSFYDEWEDGVNMSSQNYDSGITLHYGGDSFSSESSNNIVTVQDSVFYQTAKKDSYWTNKYKENSFIKNGKIIEGYEEYLPYYIKKNLKEFSQEDTKNIKSFAYKNYKFIENPYSGNMCTDYSIIVPSGKTHLYCIDNKIYNSIINNVLVDYKGNVVSGVNGNPYYIYYINEATKQHPYILYNNVKIFGVYNNGKYVFTFKKIPKGIYDWFYISEKTYEYIEYNDKILEIDNTDKSVKISYNQGEMTFTYSPINGYILDDNLIDIAAIISYSSETKTYFCGISKLDDYYNIYYIPYNNTKFKNLIIGKWDNKYKGYFITDDMVLHYIEPYQEYSYGYVRGKVKSRLSELQDFTKSYDRYGKELDGLYCGNEIMPSDKTILDIYYHVGNISNLTMIDSYKETNDIVYGNVKSKICNYYWGNLLTSIEFYFKDDNEDIISSTSVSALTQYDIKPTQNFVDYNIQYISASTINYLKTKYYTLKNDEKLPNFSSSTDDNFIISGNTVYQINSYYRVTGDSQVYYVVQNWYPISNFFDLYNLLDRKIYCKICYNIGAIIKRPYTIDENGKYIYGMYKLTDNYHKGVEYNEEYTISTSLTKYYSDEDNFIDIHSFTLVPTEEIEYYLDEEPDEDSDVFTANTAYFAMETIPNLSVDLDKENVKYTKDINSTISDGRQFNFYNGLMASPLMFEEYNIGTTSLRNVKDNIYINRGVNYAFDKHIRLMEIKTLDALENYGNGFFSML